MKVLMSTRGVFPFHGYGGMERYYYNLGRHLAAEGVDVEIVASFFPGISKRRAMQEGLSFTFLPPDFSGVPPALAPLWYSAFNWSVKRYLVGQEFDILHGTAGLKYYLPLKGRKPVVFQPFGIEPFKAKGFSLAYNYLAYYSIKPVELGMSEAIASEGETQTSELVALFGIDRSKVFTLPDGVDISAIAASLRNCGISREKLGFRKDDFVVITVNRLDAIKGLNYLIAAFGRIRKEVGNARLIMIGSGPEEEKLNAQIKGLGLSGCVLRLKNVNDADLYGYLALADVYVSPSLQNCLLLSVMEAMACGLPIVSTDMQEGMVQEGVNGYVATPRDAASIANAVMRVYDRNEGRRMGKRSRSIARRHDWRLIAKKAIREYERVIAD